MLNTLDLVLIYGCIASAISGGAAIYWSLVNVRRLRSEHTLATVKLYLSSYRSALRAIDPEHPALRARKHRSYQRFSYLALTPEETRSINAAYQTQIHNDQSDLFPLDSKIAGSSHQSLTEKMLPDAVDHYPRAQRIIRRGNPPGQR